jgi:hypothetical protein
MASTYVNDLRLNEMATGDASGTWGTTTNTNLELIAEAFSYGTEAITTNADTHTTTIADGATDPGRALYLKYTGTLDSACTITIGPNTVSKVWIVENGTSGSQDIILSQGSGANITIPAGDTKVVYSDGAGSGAAFFDAFASLSVVDLKVQDDLTVTGDIDVDGTTNLDVVDIDGAVNMATTALVTGVLTTTAATVFNGGFASNAASTLTGNLGVTGVTTSGTSSVGTDNTAPSALILRHESDQTSGFDDNFGVGMKFNADASNGGYATHAELQATQKSAGYQLRFKVGGTERLNLDSTGGFVTTPAAAGHAVFNEGGVDADFRVESDGNTHMLFVDAGNNRVGVGTSTPDSPFDVDSSEESSTALVSTFRAGSDNSNNRANVFIGQDDNSRGLLIRAGREIGDRAITQFITNGSGGTIGSNIVNVLEFYESTSSTDFETTFNQDGENVDFRVESDGNANALFVDASANVTYIGKNTGALGTAGFYFAANTGNAEFTGDGSTDPLRINRLASDGTLIGFYQATSPEGSISVSGSTVSYNGFAGRHESSGIATTTAKGTVVSTIDELDEYLSGQRQGQTRADHAKVKVSNTVGDARVYGVVDDFTDEGKVNVISVGIGSIKVTGACAGGDLLESNGDGTAKVQTDDIVRSKTIGKVTIGDSNTGVKLVSCVLYCG